MSEVPNLVTPTQLADLYPALKPRTIRYWLQNASPRTVSENGVKRTIPGNGLGSAVIRKGRVVLVDLDRFQSWLYEGVESA